TGRPRATRLLPRPPDVSSVAGANFAWADMLGEPSGPGDGGPMLYGMKVFNLYNGELGNSSDREGWRFKAAMVGKQIGGELIGAGLYEVEPGNKLWPYHTHHANEEWLLVLRGPPTPRTPQGERQLQEGDVVCFRRRAEGAHQGANRHDAPVRVLMLSTLIRPDIVEYLDSGKVGARSATGERILLS